MSSDSYLKVEELPLITVFTLIFNTGKYVIEALESLNRTEYPREKIQNIIIDDFSTDNSLQLVENWIGANNYNCELIKHKENWGVCKTLNQVIELSKGEYITGLSDDIILPKSFKKLVFEFSKLEKDFAVVFGDAELIDEHSNLLFGKFIQRYKPKLTNVPEGNIFDNLLEGNFIPMMASLIKVNAIRDVGGFDENLKYEDYDLWLRISRKYQFRFINSVVAQYRIRKDGLSENIDWAYDNFTILLKHVDSASPILINKVRSLVASSYRRGKPYSENMLYEYRKCFDDLKLMSFFNRLGIGYGFYKIVSKLFGTT